MTGLQGGNLKRDLSDKRLEYLREINSISVSNKPRIPTCPFPKHYFSIWQVKFNILLKEVTPEE